nr:MULTISPECIES: SDR family NAD(P)-dependent oxidoreductase [unclassified Stenotrophomonas]
MKYTFPGQSVLVTGAASGIGEATARLLAANGLSVVVSDCRPTRSPGSSPTSPRQAAAPSAMSPMSARTTTCAPRSSVR